VSIPVRLAIELVLFGAAAIGLAVAGQPVLAVSLAVAAALTSLVNAFTAPGGFETRRR
jgi:hypothetical protein